MGRLPAVSACVALQLLLSALGEACPDTWTPADVLAYFQHETRTSVDAFLARLRPLPLAPAARAEVLSSLPPEGDLSPTATERAKLTAAVAVLAYHHRADVITFKVADVDHAFVGLHARSVLIASRDALALVTREEFAALVAHEVAHDFVWSAYSTAVAARDHSATRELELRCDGIAVLTLLRLGMSPEFLVSAVRKLTRFNERRHCVASEADYVSLDERVRFIRSMARLQAPTVKAIARARR